MLLSIVCALYYNDLNIPKYIDELYGRCLEGMLGSWDAFRNIARNTILSELSINQRKVLVSYLAAYLFQNNKIVFSAKDVKDFKIIDSVAKTLRSKTIDEEELLKSLYNDFGLIIEQAPGLYSFSHLTFHEYLTALYVVDQRKEIELLSNYRNNPEWREVIRLVSRMLPNADEYLKYIMSTIQLSSVEEVDLIKNIWAAEPICSPDVSKKMALIILQKISHSAKYYKNANFIIEDDILTIEIEKMSNMKLGKTKEGDKQKKFHPMYMLPLSLPTLLKILYKIGYNFEELLGNSNNEIISILKQHNYPKITKVKITSKRINKSHKEE